jgi:hypothetical protein
MIRPQKFTEIPLDGTKGDLPKNPKPAKYRVNIIEIGLQK